jgi:hypothetical protein
MQRNETPTHLKVNFLNPKPNFGLTNTNWSFEKRDVTFDTVDRKKINKHQNPKRINSFYCCDSDGVQYFFYFVFFYSIKVLYLQQPALWPGVKDPKVFICPYPPILFFRRGGL